MQKLDLMTAKVNAAALSKKKATVVFLVADEDGDFSLSYNPVEGTQYAFRNGSELPTDEVDQLTSIKPKKEKVMSTEKKTTPAKKGAPVAKGKKEAPAKKGSTKIEGTGKATTLVLTGAQWKKLEAALSDAGSNIREAVREAIVAKYKL